MIDEYFQRIEKLREIIEKRDITQKQLAIDFSYLVTSANNLDIETQNKALIKIAELVEFAAVQGSPELAAMVATIGGAIVELKKVNPMLLLPQVYTLMMNMLHHAKPILEKHMNTPNPNEKELQHENPQSYYAWQVLERAWLPLKTILTHSREARENLRSSKQFNAFLIPYVKYREGCMWVFRALHIYDGEMLIFHPEHMRGYRIKVADIDHPFTLSHLLTQKLVGDPSEGLIPKKPKSSDITQFWVYNWEIIKEMPNDFKDLSVMEYLKSPTYLGSESWMFDLSFYDEVPVLILIDTDFSFSFNVPGSFPELTPEISIQESFDESIVKEWLAKLRKVE